MKKIDLKTYALEEKIFGYLLIFSVLLSVICIICNIIIGFDFSINYKWLALIIMALIALKRLVEEKNILPFQIIIFSIVIFIFLPNGWITTGGVNNLTVAYSFLIGISVCLVLDKRIRLFFIVGEVFVLILLFSIQWQYPHLITSNPFDKQMRDAIIQVPLTLIAMAFMMIIFVNAYRLERKKLKEYGQLLKENNQRLIEISIKDELTGVYNRRYVFEKLESLKRRIEELTLNTMIIMIDIDNFKKINDTYGHVAGDNLLKQVSMAIVKVIDGKGFVGRYGGDEFIIVLEEVTIQEAEEIVEKIKRIKIDNSDIDSVTLSGGMVRLTEEENIHTCLMKADKLMYQVKQNTKDDILFKETYEIIV